MMNDLSYANHTRNTNEPLKRLAHGSRLQQVAKILPLIPEMKVLDYGCGDGGFFEFLNEFIPAENIHGFDPYLLSELQFEGAKTYDNVSELIDNHSSYFDVIYVMEVCEHLTYEAIFELFDNITKVSKPDVTIVFGVPLETGLSGFIKNIYRVVKGGRQGATIGRALKSLLGLYIPRASAPRGWIGSHIGFDAKAFSELFGYGGFIAVETYHLPFPVLGEMLNNEVYYVCKLTQKS
jgi:2-polyprenyl-3-methyl-5-hydroxy-6-metoxy-1,4-benzoquinol methylase